MSAEHPSAAVSAWQAEHGAGERHGGDDGPASTVRRLEELIERLERAGEQLRSGELSADAAAGMVEDCASLATQAAAELEQLTRAEAPTQPPPGQDTLL